MAFYIVVKGHITPFDFKYLKDAAPLHLDKTQIRGEAPIKGINKNLLEKQAAEVPALKVMTKKIITLSPAAKMSEAKKIMTEKKIHHIPLVVDWRLTGMISWHDLTLPKEELEKELRVHERMSKIVLCASEYTPLRHIAQVFYQENINSLPIVDEDLVVTGIITHRDLLKWMIEQNKFTLFH